MCAFTNYIYLLTYIISTLCNDDKMMMSTHCKWFNLSKIANVCTKSTYF